MSRWPRVRGRARAGLLKVRGLVRWARVQGPITKVFGPRYRRSRRLIEIDITWACNLRCYNCNRSCEQAPTGEQMTLAQIERFVQESVQAGQRWDRIRVLGGEPTLHPRFVEIMMVLRSYQRDHSPSTVVEVATNGHGDRVNERLAALPPEILVDNSHKEGPDQPFETFNVAPMDLRAYRGADFRSGCWVTERCGVGLTPYGYYPCAVAGGIDRIVGLDMARKQLPDPLDDMEDQLDAFCRRCGSFKRGHQTPVEGPVTSSSWHEAYRAHRENPPELTRY